MEPDLMMPAGVDEGIGQVVSPLRREQRRRQPRRLICIEKNPGLLTIAGPPGMVAWHAGSWIGGHRVISACFAGSDIPPLLRRCAAATKFRGHNQVSIGSDQLEEGSPNRCW